MSCCVGCDEANVPICSTVGLIKIAQQCVCFLEKKKVLQAVRGFSVVRLSLLVCEKGGGACSFQL